MMGRFTNEELIRAIETTYYEDMSALCSGIPGSFLSREADMIIYSSGLPIALLNGVFGPRFNSRDLSKRVEAAMSYFKDAQLPMMWDLGPSSTPPELDRFLSGQGMVQGLTTGMAIDLNTMNHEPLPSGLEIRPIQDMESLQICIDTSFEGFEFPGYIRNGWDALIKNFGMSPARRWFLGMLNKRPVSTSLLVLHEDVASVYMVTTLKEQRGKGIGSAITREPLHYARNAGYDVGVLEATKSGIMVYEKLGFIKLCEFRTFTWTP